MRKRNEASQASLLPHCCSVAMISHGLILLKPLREPCSLKGKIQDVREKSRLEDLFVCRHAPLSMDSVSTVSVITDAFYIEREGVRIFFHLMAMKLPLSRLADSFLSCL